MAVKEVMKAKKKELKKIIKKFPKNEKLGAICTIIHSFEVALFNKPESEITVYHRMLANSNYEEAGLDAYQIARYFSEEEIIVARKIILEDYLIKRKKKYEK